MIALRSAAPDSGGFGPERVRRVPAMAASSASTASTKSVHVGKGVPRGLETSWRG